MKPRLFFILLFSLPCWAWAQFPIPDDQIKNEFSQRYLQWRILSDGLSDQNMEDFDSISTGCHYPKIQLTEVQIPGIHFPTLIGVELRAENQLDCEDELSMVRVISDWAPPERGTEHFLLGITSDNKIRYLSGHVLLDPYLTDDFAASAQMRLYYLQPEKIQLLRGGDGCDIFRAYSRLLHKSIRLKMYHADAYSIWLKGEHRPFVEIGKVAQYENAWRKKPSKER